jgi:hypothetical protein
MRMRIQGPSIRFIDQNKATYEEVRDLEFGPENREPASHADVCSWTAPQFECWLATGRRPRTVDEEPDSRQAQLAQSAHFAAISDARHGYRGALTADEMRGLSPSEKFAAASAARWASFDPRGRLADLRRRRSE